MHLGVGEGEAAPFGEPSVRMVVASVEGIGAGDEDRAASFLLGPTDDEIDQRRAEPAPRGLWVDMDLGPDHVGVVQQRQLDHDDAGDAALVPHRPHLAAFSGVLGAVQRALLLQRPWCGVGAFVPLGGCHDLVAALELGVVEHVDAAQVHAPHGRDAAAADAPGFPPAHRRPARAGWTTSGQRVEDLLRRRIGIARPVHDTLRQLVHAATMPQVAHTGTQRLQGD